MNLLLYSLLLTGVFYRYVAAQHFSDIDLPFVLKTGACATGDENPAVINAAFTEEVFYLTNYQRSLAGVPPLKRNANLDRSAQYHATDMGVENYFDHDSHDRNGDSLVVVCTTFERIRKFYPEMAMAGENIARGYSKPANVITGWMNSMVHRQNIESPNYSEIGIGYYNGNYWVQNFGTPTGRFPLLINSDSMYTNSTTVSLYIHGMHDSMRIKNNNEAFTAWMPFKNNIVWNLPNTIGKHTVTAELKKNDTNYITGDEIEYRQSVGMSQYLLTMPLLLFPNPAENQLTFQTVIENNLPIDITITDAVGSTVFKATENAAGGLFAKTIMLDDLDLPAGMYHFRVQQGDKRAVRRFVKQ
jgi:uncharacterized protein YkwD